MSIDTIIEEKTSILATLAVELERATIANQTRGDQSLYVSEPGMFPFWVDIREGIRCILLHSYLEFVPECEHTDRLELCDRINQQLCRRPSTSAASSARVSPTASAWSAAIRSTTATACSRATSSRLCRLFSDGRDEAGRGRIRTPAAAGTAGRPRP